jgi:hypothetical protein
MPLISYWKKSANKQKNFIGSWRYGIARSFFLLGGFDVEKALAVGHDLGCGGLVQGKFSAAFWFALAALFCGCAAVV